jgi:hypothetical protein
VPRFDAVRRKMATPPSPPFQILAASRARIHSRGTFGRNRGFMCRKAGANSHETDLCPR